jgi:hypothetical protein
MNLTNPAQAMELRRLCAVAPEVMKWIEAIGVLQVES